ncbi:MAG: hypothetical protein AAEJ52_05350, partial [Myxococcota bacterium]
MKGSDTKRVGVVAVSYPWRTDAVAAAQGFELCERSPEHSGGGTRWAKQVELVVFMGAAVGLEPHCLYRSLRRLGLERVTDQAHEDPQVDGGGGRADASGIAAAALLVERERQLVACHVAGFEARKQSGEQALQDEDEWFEAIER